MEPPLTTCSTSLIKHHAPWHSLKHVWVGSSYSPEFYESIKNTKIRDSLQQIAKETEEDYQALVNTLIDLGVYVQRPVIDNELTILDYTDQNTGRLSYHNSGSYTLIPKPPMQPRDCQLIVGDTYVVTNKDSKWLALLVQNLNIKKKITPPKDFDAPMVTVVGQHMIIDCREDPWLYDFFVEHFPDYTIIPVMIGGHNDAVFCLLRPGLLVSTHHHDNYKNTLPGWTVKFIQNQSWDAIPNWKKLKHSNNQKWWVPDNVNNPEFDHFVNTWLKDWVGFVAETVFDVNMLQINDRTVLVNNFNKDMFDFFKLHNIEPIVVPFRHRFFWDGGLHCITSDIFREGEFEKYVDTR